MPHYAHGRPKDHGKKPDKDTEQGECTRGEFVQVASDSEKNRDRSQPDEQRKFSADRAPKLLRVFRLLNCIRFSDMRRSISVGREPCNQAMRSSRRIEQDLPCKITGIIYPPAIAPMIRNGSAPFAIASGSGASGDS